MYNEKDYRIEEYSIKGEKLFQVRFKELEDPLRGIVVGDKTKHFHNRDEAKKGAEKMIKVLNKD